MLKKKHIFLSIFAVVTVISIFLWLFLTQSTKKAPIKIGILHSLTGPFAAYEKPIVDATILAIEEINAQGGVLGHTLKSIIRDGQSDATHFAQEAQSLITQEKVAAIFGCWSSVDRKAVKPIVEQYNSFLFYPVQHEGLEDSPNIVYTSTIPNQQAIPAMTWCLKNLGTAFFLVGSDELLPRATNEILKDAIALFDGTVVGEEYIDKKKNTVEHIVQKIKKSNPQVIINTIIGDDNKLFFTLLRQAEISAEKIPTMSLCVDESDLERFGTDDLIGDYSAWSHFQSIERTENKKFVEKIKQRYGKEYLISDASEAAYYGVHLWKQAVTKAHTVNTANVQITLKNQAFNAPEGIIYIDDTTQHTWSVMSIGKIRSDKQFTVLWNSLKAIRPTPYPFFKTRHEWDELLNTWYKQWGNKWFG